MKIKKINWSDIRQPGLHDDRRFYYTHVVADCILGVLMIDWKDHKSAPTYDCYIDGNWFDSGSSLDECKEIFQNKILSIVKELVE